MLWKAIGISAELLLHHVDTECVMDVICSQLQNELDQEYQDKFRRLPVEIQEFVQETTKRKTDGNDQESLPSSSTLEKLSHKGVQSEDDMEDERKD